MANMVKTTPGSNVRQILLFTQPHAALGAKIGDTGVVAVAGRKIIPAGTPVGGANNFLENQQAVLTVSNGAEAQGVLQYDVDVTDGEENGSVLIFGFVNLNRVDPSLTITPEAIAALDGKVTFARRN